MLAEQLLNSICSLRFQALHTLCSVISKNISRVIIIIYPIMFLNFKQTYLNIFIIGLATLENDNLTTNLFYCEVLLSLWTVQKILLKLLYMEVTGSFVWVYWTLCSTMVENLLVCISVSSLWFLQVTSIYVWNLDFSLAAEVLVINSVGKAFLTIRAVWTHEYKQCYWNMNFYFEDYLYCHCIFSEDGIAVM